MRPRILCWQRPVHRMPEGLQQHRWLRGCGTLLTLLVACLNHFVLDMFSTGKLQLVCTRIRVQKRYSLRPSKSWTWHRWWLGSACNSQDRDKREAVVFAGNETFRCLAKVVFLPVPWANPGGFLLHGRLPQVILAPARCVDSIVMFACVACLDSWGWIYYRHGWQDHCFQYQQRHHNQHICRQLWLTLCTLWLDAYNFWWFRRCTIMMDFHGLT